MHIGTRALAGAALSALLLTGCAAGFDATTTQPYAPADGVNGQSGGIKVLDALVVAPSDSTEGVVSMTLVNEGEGSDQIESLESSSGMVDFTGPRELPPGGSVRLGAGSNPSATVQNLTVQPGFDITLKLTFEKAGPITLRTVVAPAEGYYASVTPPPPAESSPITTPVESPSTSETNG